jgi:divalent metal cation (Fe/Co/Zn/Cd) transporter
VPEARIVDAKARWIGHKLHADVAIDVDESLPLSAANKIASDLEDELFEHIPVLAVANIRFAPGEASDQHLHSHSHGYHS